MPEPGAPPPGGSGQTPGWAPPGGPQSPAPDPQAPPQFPAGPQSPAGQQAPPQFPAGRPGPPPPGWGAPPAGYQPPLGAGPEGPQAPPAPPPYGGPVPPGGWHQPPAPVAPGIAGAQLASWGSRAGALLLDILVIIGVVIALFAPGGILLGVGVKALGIVLLAVAGLVYLVVILLYAPYLMQRRGPNNGQTLGKQWVGIRAVRDTGEPFTWGPALLRELVVKNLLFGWVGSLFFSIPTLLDYLWPLWDDQNRALHDMVASTHVVRA